MLATSTGMLQVPVLRQSHNGYLLFLSLSLSSPFDAVRCSAYSSWQGGDEGEPVSMTANKGWSAIYILVKFSDLGLTFRKVRMLIFCK